MSPVATSNRKKTASKSRANFGSPRFEEAKLALHNELREFNLLETPVQPSSNLQVNPLTESDFY